MLFKSVPYTPATAVPLVVRWDAQIPTGEVDSRLALNVDIATTIARATSAAMLTAGLDLLGDRRARRVRARGARRSRAWTGRRTAAGGRRTGASRGTPPARRSSTREQLDPYQLTNVARPTRRPTASWTTCAPGPSLLQPGAAGVQLVVRRGRSAGGRVGVRVHRAAGPGPRVGRVLAGERRRRAGRAAGRCRPSRRARRWPPCRSTPRPTPGCGPWVKPDGCSEIEPSSMPAPLRLMKSPPT